MQPATRRALEDTLGGALRSVEPVSGGDINEAFRVTLDGRAPVFVKSHRAPPAGMFEAEAAGLRWLAEPGVVRVPEVLAAGADWLALEWIESGAPRGDHDERLGRSLAGLHRAGAPRFGAVADNFIATIPQRNAAEEDWPSFYRARRLEPLLRRAVDRGLASPTMRAGFAELFASLPERVGPAEPPSRLHGDLWGGNRMCDADGAPVLIDPAAYAGHREVDLAMMRLFGGFGARVFDAYAEAAPLAPGAEGRVPLYQLYPLMVHVLLFGGSYVGSVERALRGHFEQE